jgi:transposase
VSTTEIMDKSLRAKRRHKVWPEALKREVVAAYLVPGASVSVVARHYDVNTNMVFTWRKLYGGVPETVAPQLLPVVVTLDPPIAAPPAPSAGLHSAGLIEIELRAATVFGSAATSRPRRYALCWMRWSGDDRISIERARMVGGWADGYASRDDGPCLAGSAIYSTDVSFITPSTMGGQRKAPC